MVQSTSRSSRQSAFLAVAPLVGWRSIVFGAATLGLFGFIPGCGSEPPPPPPVEAPPEPPKPKPEPIELGALSPVELLPAGTAKTKLAVERRGNQGVIEVNVKGLPKGVTAEAKAIPADAING